MKPYNVISIAFSFLIISCGGGDQQVQKVYDYERSDSLPPQYTTHLGNIRVSIEEVNSLNKLFRQNGYSYNNNILNSAGKASGYSNSKSQAVNLGIYGSDVNYALAFDQNQDVLNYVKAIAELAQKLGIEKAFDETLVKKLTEGSDTVSDKSMLLTRAYRHAQDQLHNEERAAIATMIVFGGWLEGIYIASNNLKSKPGNAEINQKIFENLDTFKDVLQMLKAFEKNKNCAEILSEANEISATIQSLIQTKGNFSAEDISTLNNVISGLRNKQI